MTAHNVEGANTRILKQRTHDATVHTRTRLLPSVVRSTDFASMSRQPSPTPTVPTKTSGLAVASLVLGILGLCSLASIMAVVFGHVAINQIKRSNGSQTGRGMAIAGLILGYIWLALVLLFVVAAYAS